MAQRARRVPKGRTGGPRDSRFEVELGRGPLQRGLHALDSAVTLRDDMGTRRFARAWVLGSLLGVVACGGGDGDAPATPGVGNGSGGTPGSGGGPTTGGAPGTGGTAGSSSGPLPPAPTCNGQMSPCVPVVLDSGLPTPGTFQVRNGHLYWRNSADYDAVGLRDPNSVLRLRLPDGAPEVVAGSTEGTLMSVAVDDTHVYFADGGIGRVPLAGGTPEVLASGLSSLVVVVDDTHVYFTSQQNGLVGRVPKTGGSAEPVVSEVTPVHVGLDDTHVYWVNQAADPYTLERSPKAGGAVEILAADVPRQPEKLVVLDDGIYLPVDRPVESTAAGEPRGLVLRYPKTGGAALELTSHAAPFGAIGVDEGFVYVATCPGVEGEAVLLRVPRGGGAAVTIASGGLCYVGVAVDATRAYFGEWGAPDYAPGGDGRVLSVDKCGCP